jgi:hypothetical protein
VVLEGPVVERLIAIAEEGREQVARGPAAQEVAVGAQPRVVAAEPDQAGLGRGLGLHLEVERGQRPGPEPEQLGPDVADPRRTLEHELGGREEHTVAAPLEHLDDLHVAVGPGPHDEPNGGGGPIGSALVSDQDRVRDGDPGGDVDHHGVDEQRVAHPAEGVGRLRKVAEQPGLQVVAPQDSRSAELSVLHGGVRGGGGEPLQVELVDAAVAPDVVVGARHFGVGEVRSRLGAAVGQPPGAGQGSDAVDGERAHRTFRTGELQAIDASAKPPSPGVAISGQIRR